jgi:outer membrane receptor protein involved in Fe transport
MDPGDDYKQQIPYTPLNSGSLLISADWRRFALNYSFIYTGSRYDESANIPVNYLEPWYTHDLAMSYTLPFHGSQLKGGVEVNNLFNQYYDVIANFPMPGRNYRFILQLTM